MNLYLTNIPDIDYQILIEVPFHELKKLCQTNRYTRGLCQNKTFWINKLIHDGISLPSPDLFKNDLNWIKVCDVLYSINEHIDGIGKDAGIAIINKNNILFYKFLEKYSLPINGNEKWKFINFFYLKRTNDYILEFMAFDGSYYDVFEKAHLTYQNLIDFLFEAMMNNVITKLIDDDTYERLTNVVNNTF